MNSELVALDWEVGTRLRKEVLGEERAAYGEKVVADVAKVLSAEFGRGFSKRNLHYMVRFAEVFPDPETVRALRSQLSWTHFRELIGIEEPLKRRFYAELCQVEGWSTRTLKKKVGAMLFERTAIAKRPEAVAAGVLDTLRDEEQMSPDSGTCRAGRCRGRPTGSRAIVHRRGHGLRPTRAGVRSPV